MNPPVVHIRIAITLPGIRKSILELLYYILIYHDKITLYKAFVSFEYLHLNKERIGDLLF